MNLQESGEMYLETILILSRKQQTVRAIDISEYMGYTKPSVSRALGLLKEGGYVVSDKDGFLSLTEIGLETAEKILSRHTVISKYLIKLGVSPETASNDACKIEHVISEESFKAIKSHL
ncbi:MAG: metal-dependent transcriptional regulator [Ruminococcaceae bacterium]|nr:metal-dependent transcriptional regulator [Oscillospiraceae bacterium]